MKKVLAIVFTFTLAICNLIGDSFHYDPHSNLCVPSNETNSTSVSVTEDSLGITVSYSIGTLYCQESENLDEWYSISLDGFGFNETFGFPAIPFKVDQFTLPEDVESVVLSIQKFSYTEISINIIENNIPVLNNQKDTLTLDKPASIGNYNGADSIVGIHCFGHRKDIPIAYIEVSPIQYDTTNKKVRIYKDFTYRIDYVKKSVNFAKIITSRNDFPPNLWSRSYLVISTYAFEPEIKPFVEWKRQMGFNVIESYRDKWIHETVKQAIDSVYKENHNLQYVLLVGDNASVPAVPNRFKGKFASDTDDNGRKYVSDFPYSCIDGDSIADINIGRIPAWNKSKVKNAFHKILSYEKNPSTYAPAYNTAMHTAVFDTRAENPTQSIDPCVYTARTIRDYILQQGIDCIENYSAWENTNPLLWYGSGDSIPSDLRRPNFKWDGTVDSLFQTINKGALYVMNNVHGNITNMKCSMSFPHEYTTEDAAAQTNTFYPIVFNISCLTGFFGNQRPLGMIIPSYKKSLTQFLMCENETGGSPAIFSANESTVFWYDDEMAIGFINALWPNPGLGVSDNLVHHNINNRYKDKDVPTLGKIMEWGRDFMAAKYGRTFLFVKFNERVRHLFGDPSMWVNTEVPTNFKNISTYVSNSYDVSDVPELSLSDNKMCDNINIYDNINISVKFDKEDHSIISFMDNTGKSMSFTGNEAEVFNMQLPVTLTITGHNKIPYISTLTGVQQRIKSKLKISNVIHPKGDDNCQVHIVYKDAQDNIIDIENSGYNKLILYLYSDSGILKKTVPSIQPSDIILIPCGDLEPATYVLVLSADNEYQDSKVVVIK